MSPSGAPGGTWTAFVLSTFPSMTVYSIVIFSAKVSGLGRHFAAFMTTIWLGVGRLTFTEAPGFAGFSGFAGAVFVSLRVSAGRAMGASAYSVWIGSGMGVTLGSSCCSSDSTRATGSAGAGHHRATATAIATPTAMAIHQPRDRGCGATAGGLICVTAGRSTSERGGGDVSVGGGALSGSTGRSAARVSASGAGFGAKVGDAAGEVASAGCGEGVAIWEGRSGWGVS